MVPSWADQLLPQLFMEQFDNLYIQYRHIEHMHEVVWLNFLLTKLQLRELRQFFTYMAFVYAWIVPLWADQLLPQLLMGQFDSGYNVDILNIYLKEFGLEKIIFCKMTAVRT